MTARTTYRAIAWPLAIAASFCGIFALLPLQPAEDAPQPVEPERQPSRYGIPDGTTWYLVVICHPARRELHRWFESEPQLAAMAAKTRYQALTTASRTYRDTWYRGIRAPAVMLIDAAGGSVYKATAGNVPDSAPALAAAINQAIYHYHQHQLLGRPCPGPDCPIDEPGPDHEPPQIDRGPLVPDTKQATQFPPLAAIGAIVLAIAAAAFYRFSN